MTTSNSLKAPTYAWVAKQGRHDTLIFISTLYVVKICSASVSEDNFCVAHHEKQGSCYDSLLRSMTNALPSGSSQEPSAVPLDRSHQRTGNRRIHHPSAAAAAPSHQTISSECTHPRTDYHRPHVPHVHLHQPLYKRLHARCANPWSAYRNGPGLSLYPLMVMTLRVLVGRFSLALKPFTELPSFLQFNQHVKVG